MEVSVGSHKDQDWAQELVAEIRDCGIQNNADSTRRFVEVYQGGDTLDAWKRYTDGAAAHESADGQSTLIIFGDGSVYCDAAEGINRFSPTLAKLREESPDEVGQFGR
jgi:hypothetical protein